MSLAALRAVVRKAEAAYRLGEPTGYTDEEFDWHVRQLTKLMPDAPELQVPGGGTELLSLDNGTFMTWYESLGARTSLVVQPKIDGCAIALTYVDGVLSAAHTRSGRDVLDRIKMISSIPKAIPEQVSVQVNGELYNPAFVDRPSKSQQQAAAHLNKRPKPEGLRFCAYTLVGQHGDESKALSLLSKWRFEIPDCFVCTKPEEIKGLHEQWLRQLIFRNWPTDGIVVKVYNHRLQQKLGSTTKAPRWALAMKQYSSFDESDYD